MAILALAFALVSNWTAYVVGASSSREGDQAHRGMCALRAAVSKNYMAGVKFLHAHPNGTHDFPASVFKGSIKNQSTTLDALKFLNCKD
jgi:hypothetical protein